MKERLESVMDRRFGFAPSGGRYVGTSRPDTEGEGVNNMSNPTAKASRPYGTLKKAVERLLLDNPGQPFRADRVTKMIDASNEGSVADALATLHNETGSEVHRVGSGTYAVPTLKIPEVPEAPAPAPQRKEVVTDLWEVVYRNGDRVVVLDTDDNLLVVTVEVRLEA